jgi:uncharacterized membrane protein HdeD (DUF308 family)
MTNWIFWLIIGLIVLVGGIAALMNPFAATFTAEQIAAWVFIFGGVLQLVAIFQVEGWGRRIWAILLGIAFLWLGISLLTNPLAGIVSLTIVAAIMFLVSGVAKLFLAFSARGSGYFWAILLSGAISVVLALMIFSNFPESAAVVLGVLLAVELITTGATLVAFAFFLRNNKEALLSGEWGEGGGNA